MDAKTIDFEELGRQLKKPEGEFGIKVGEAMNRSNLPMYEMLYSVLKPKDGDSLLEVGFGNGKFFEKYLELNENLQLKGIDFSETMYREACANNKSLLETKKLELYHAPLLEAPLESASVDHLIAINVIYFWKPAETHLQKILNLLKPGGKFYAVYRPEETFRHFEFSKEEFTIYRPEQLTALLKSAGFTIISETENVYEDKNFGGTKFNCRDICLVGSRQ